MNKVLLKLGLLAIGMSLVSCASNTAVEQHPVVTNYSTEGKGNGESAMIKQTSVATTTLAGDIEKVMDENDKVKLSHALDKPLGKVTRWTNDSTGYNYTVVPVRKLVLNGNPFCRKYTVTAIKNESGQEVTGVACVSATDSSWQVMQSY